VADDFSERYGDLLQGSYDCVDRIVLNAFYSMGHSAGGFREWWRRLNNGSEDNLDNAHLIRMAGRFSRRVHGFARVHGTRSSTADVVNGSTALPRNTSSTKFPRRRCTV
jgi:hypothetical protein